MNYKRKSTVGWSIENILLVSDRNVSRLDGVPSVSLVFERSDMTCPVLTLYFILSVSVVPDSLQDFTGGVLSM